MTGARELVAGEGSSPDLAEWEAETQAGPFRRSLSVGFLAMLPLFLAYELGVGASEPAWRNASELVLFHAARLFPLPERELRVALLAIAAAAALVVCFRRRVALGPSLLRVVLEGLVAAALFGPAMALAMRLLPAGLAQLDVEAAPPAGPPSAAEVGLAFGGAAYEELLFRVVVLALVFLGARRILDFFGAGERPARLGAQVTAVLASSACFAAFHLRAFTGWLGPGGEAFAPAIFAWRSLAGLLLALLFLWRGPGVAAWTHGLFNFALFLGAGPEVLL